MFLVEAGSHEDHKPSAIDGFLKNTIILSNGDKFSGYVKNGKPTGYG